MDINPTHPRRAASPRRTAARAMPSRRAVLAAMAAMTTIGAVSACAPGGGGQGDGGQQTQSSAGPVSLLWWDYIGPGPAQDTLAATLKEYQDANPGVTIERQFVAYADLKQSLLQSAGAGSLPDVVIINGPDHQQFAELGVAADLTDRLQEWGQLDQYPKGAIASASLDDRIYGLPWSLNCLALYYNRAMLTQAGLQPPTTWEQYADAATALTTPDHRGLAFSAINNQQAVFQWLPTLWQAGGDLDSLDGHEATQALTFWADFVSSGSVSQEALNWDQSQVATEFAQQRAAMMVNGPWQFPFLASEAPDLDYGVALLPVGKEEATALGGENLMVIDGPKADAAWDLLTWLQEPKRLQAFNTATGSLPTRADAAPADVDAKTALFIEQLKVARPRAYGSRYNEIADQVVTAIQGVLSGSQQPGPALTTAAAGVTPLLPA